jgi:hypothetical protein
MVLKILEVCHILVGSKNIQSKNDNTHILGFKKKGRSKT